MQAGSGDAVGGVRVEAWDKDDDTDDYLGSATTISDGSFTIRFSQEMFQDLFVDKWPDIYFKVFCVGILLVSTEKSILWNVHNPDVWVTIEVPEVELPPCGERNIYLKIERIEGYSPVRPQEKVVPPMQYGPDCMGTKVTRTR